MVSRDVASLAQKIEGETKSVVDKIEDTKRWVVEHVENLFSKKFIWLVGSLIGGVGVLYTILRLLENARPWRLDLGRDRCCRRDPYSCDLDVAVAKTRMNPLRAETAAELDALLPSILPPSLKSCGVAGDKAFKGELSVNQSNNSQQISVVTFRS